MALGNSFDLEGFLRLEPKGVEDTADKVRNIEDAANDAGDAVETNLGDKLGDIGSSMQGVGTKLTAGVTLPILGIGGASLKSASQAEEAESRFQNVFENTSDRVSDFAENFADEIGRSSRTIKDQAADFGSLLAPMVEDEEKAAALSEQFTTLTQDIASFEDMDPQRVQEALMSGLSGQSRAVRQFGVDLSVEAVDAELENMGIDPEEATRGQEAQARLNRIMEDTQSAQGNAAATADSFKNQSRDLRASIKDLRIEIGEQLLPVARDIVNAVMPAVDAFTNLSDRQQTLIVTVGGLAAALGPLLLVFGSLLALIPAVASGAAVLAGAVGVSTTGLLAGAGAAAAITSALTILGAVFSDDLIPPLRAFAEDTLKNVVMPALTDAKAVFDDVMSTAKGVVTDALDTIEAAWNRHSDEIMTEVDETVEAIRPPLKTALEAVDGIVDSTLGRIEDVWSDHGDTIMSVVGALTNALGRLFETSLNNLAETAKIGLNIIQLDFGEARDNIESIADNTMELVRDAFRAGFDKVDELTGGRLTDIENAFRGLTNWLSNTWDLLASLTKPFRDAYNAIVGSSIVPELVSDVKSAFTAFTNWLAAVWDLNPLSDTFEAAADRLTGGDSAVVPTLIADIKSPLTALNDWVEGTFGVNLRRRFGDAFDGAVDAIGKAFDRLDFGPLVSGLDGIGDNVEDLIGGLNSLSGVNIDVDIPSFDGLMSRAKDIVGGSSSGDSSGSTSGGNSNDGGGGGGPSGVTAGIPTSPLTALATGGIVTDATQAIIGEGSESEAVLPLSRLEQFVDRPSGGVTINDLVINASGRREGREAGEALKRELKRFDI